MAFRVMLLVAAVACAGCGSHGWNVKATSNEMAASNRVGGFSSDDARLYHLGVQHVINRHQNVGAFTIGQLVDQERWREVQRSVLAEKKRSAQQKRAERRRADMVAASKVSAYAHSISLLLQLDYIASQEIKTQAANYSMSGVYSVAQRAVEGISGAQLGLSAKKPDGFDRTEEAAEAYMAEMRARYQATAELANDPTPKNSYAFKKANEYEYAGTVLKAFDADLTDGQFATDVRAKLRARIRGN